MVKAYEVVLKVAGFHYPEGGEDHGYAECDYPETAHRCDEVLSAAVDVLGLVSVKGGVEVCLLLWRKAELKVFAASEYIVEVMVVFSEGTEVVIEGAVKGVVKDIVPDNPGVQCVECEAAEKAVLGIGDEVEDLMWGSGQEGGEPWVADADIFSVFAPDVGDGLVVECLAEAIGVVAVVGAEGVGEGVALGLEHEAFTVVVIEYLINGCSGRISRDEKHLHGWFFRLFHGGFFLSSGVVFCESLFVFYHFCFVDFSQSVMYGLGKVTAECQAAFAGGGFGGDEEEQVGIDGAFVIYATDVGQAGGEDAERAKQQYVGILG